MKNQDDFRNDLLGRAPATTSPNGHFLSMMPIQETNRFQIPEPHIMQLTIEMCQRGLIFLHVWDGQRECSLQDWLRRSQTEHDFFHNKGDNHYVRVRLTALGAAERDRLKPTQRQIGFAALPS
jgi:hypothetical protein